MPITLAAVGDIHAGSTLALCPDEIQLDDGGIFLASPAQRWYWQNWCNYWQRVDAVRKDQLWVLLNGDLVDGQVKHSSQVVSGNPNAQAQIFNAAIAIPRALKPDRIIIVRGTEAHTGNSGSAEERIADGLWRNGDPIVRNLETNTSSWWHWVSNPDATEGVKLDVTHHGSIGKKEHTRGSQLVLYAHDIHLSYTKRDERPPDIAIRSHNHKWADSFDAVKPRVLALGAWQAGTAHVHKVAPGAIADCGGAIIQINDGQYTIEKVRYEPVRQLWTP